jgi:NTP pyrophosphatase (non-canonical NTP hydrolase)
MREDILELVKQLSLKDTKTLSQKSSKLFIEGGELADAVLTHENAQGARHKIVSKDKILDEVADVMLVALSIAYSLGYDDRDITSMMSDKAIHWSNRNDQDRSDGKYPFEIHLTLSENRWNQKPVDIEEFEKYCKTLNNLKAIVLDLGDAPQQLTTASVIIGTYDDAKMFADDLINTLYVDGYDAIRTKIETVPWHPMLRSKLNGYYESHFTFVLNNHDVERLRELVKTPEYVYYGSLSRTSHVLHISRNALKHDVDGVVKIMGTIRTDNYSGMHDSAVNSWLEKLKSVNLVPTKTVTEFALMDTKKSLDDAWMGIKA